MSYVSNLYSSDSHIRPLFTNARTQSQPESQKYAPLIPSWRKSRREGKKHNFGVKRSWEQRTFLNFKKQTPVKQCCLVFLLADKKSHQVTIPDKGSHYLKKSPSPTGSKLPPGEGGALSPINGNNDHLEEGSPVKKTQQVGASTFGESFKKLGEMGPPAASSHL